MEMIERVARAISSEGSAWTDQIEAARAAIEAMIEPTPTMRLAGALNISDVTLPSGVVTKCVVMGDDPISSYKRMVAAALKPTLPDLG